MRDGIQDGMALAALDRVTDAVLVVGSGQAVLYANPAAALLLGRPVEELVGRHTLVMLPIEGIVGSIEPIFERFRAGESWQGTFIQRRPDGSEIGIDVTAWPFDDVMETATSIVVLRESTNERDLELARTREHQAAVLSVMGSVRPLESLAETVSALCGAIAQIDGVDGAMILVRGTDSDVFSVGSAGTNVPGLAIGTSAPTAQTEVMLQLTQNGPWWQDMTADSTRELLGPERLASLTDLGITAAGYAGIHDDGHMVGVLCISNASPEGPERMPAMLPLIQHLAGFAGTVLQKQALVFGEQATLRHRVRRVIDERDFGMVLQPVVDLTTGDVQGYEALARFADDAPPDLWVRHAHSVGLGLELEEALGRLAVEEARGLDPDLWLCVNLSPDAIIGGSVGRSLLDAGRRVVVEVTEHTQVESYAAIRDEMKRHPGIDVSVDDAGAGFAGLRHIVELDPAFVKLDMGMVHDVDKDPSRAAMVAGMCHFARATGTRLIAEGIESEEEAEALRGLGVELGQGYHFGRPA